MILASTKTTYIIIASLIWSESSWLYILIADPFNKLPLIEKILYASYGLPGIISVKSEWLFYNLPLPNFLPYPIDFLATLIIISAPGTIFTFLVIKIVFKTFEFFKK